MSDVAPWIEKIAKELCRKYFMDTYTGNRLEQQVDMYWRGYIKDAKAAFAARIGSASG